MKGSLCQSKKYILRNLIFFESKSVATQKSSSSSLEKYGKCQMVDNKLYRSMIESLLYLIASRMNIMFSVCLHARFQFNPKRISSKDHQEYFDI